MTDVHSKAVRSYNMSRVKSKDTKPELIVRKALFASGLRFRVHDNNLPGKPDIVSKKYKTVVFVNGCFWHGHNNCKYFRLPGSNKKFWEHKILMNKARDLDNIKKLKKLGYRVSVIWGCEVKNEKIIMKLINYVKKGCQEF